MTAEERNKQGKRIVKSIRNLLCDTRLNTNANGLIVYSLTDSNFADDTQPKIEAIKAQNEAFNEVISVFRRVMYDNDISDILQDCNDYLGC